MKKYIALFISLMLLLTGCARVNNEDVQPGAIIGTQEAHTDGNAQKPNEPTSKQEAHTDDNAQKPNEPTSEQDAPPSGEKKEENPETAISTTPEKITPSLKADKNLPETEETFKDFAALSAQLNLEDHIIFRGIKTNTLESYSTPTAIYFPVELKVLEPLYGDIRIGEQIIFREAIGTHHDGDDVTITATEPRLENIVEEKEYIFILKKTVGADEAVNYDYVSLAHTYTKLEDAEELAAKISKGNATQIEQFRHSVLIAYEKKEYRLDLQAEAAKLMDGIGENASKEEILSALPAEQKALFEKMINQYGTK